ncbi:dTMP kinase [Stetteria hydrogenophila]
MAGVSVDGAVEAAVEGAVEEGYEGLALTWRRACPEGVRPGVLVAVEGVDGAGVTTLSRILAGALARLGLRAVYTKEPTGGPVGRLIREALVGGGVDARLAALLFAGDRLWHLASDPGLPGGSGVLGALGRGYVVVSDRYKYSSIAYQGRVAGYDWVWQVNAYAPPAHVVVYVDVDAGTALERLRARGGRWEYYHQPGEVEANLDSYKRLLDWLAEEPEHGPGREPGAWSRLLGDRGIPVGCLYPTPPAYPAIVRVDNRGSLADAARRAVAGVAGALTRMGLAAAGGASRLGSRPPLKLG